MKLTMLGSGSSDANQYVFLTHFRIHMKGNAGHAQRAKT